MNTDRSPARSDTQEFVIVLWRERLLVLGTTLLFSCIAIVYALVAKPIYRAEALVQIRQDTMSPPGLGLLAAEQTGLGSIASLVGGTNDQRALTIATLQSRVVIQGFIKDHDLLPVFFEDKWDSDNNKWNVSDPDKTPTLWHGYKFFTESVLKVTEDRKTGLVTIAIEWRDPEVAASWVSELISRANTLLRDKVIAESQRNLDYLENEGKHTGIVELQQAAFALVETDLKKLMLAKGGGEYAIRTIDPAQASKQRAKPQRRLIALAGLSLGLFIGASLALFRQNISLIRKRLITEG